jgi:hypothetical protein
VYKDSTRYRKKTLSYRSNAATDHKCTQLLFQDAHAFFWTMTIIMLCIHSVNINDATYDFSFLCCKFHPSLHPSLGAGHCDWDRNDVHNLGKGFCRNGSYWNRCSLVVCISGMCEWRVHLSRGPFTLELQLLSMSWGLEES